MGDESEDRPVSGRRSVDDGARLLIAENSLLRMETKYAAIADGQDVLNGILIGRPQHDGTVSVGLVHRVEGIREKQNEAGNKLDAVISDMGDLKTAQADQARTLTEHGDALGEIRGWIKTGVGYLRDIATWLARGVATVMGTAALWLLGQWFGPSIVHFFSTFAPAADAATKVIR